MVPIFYIKEGNLGFGDKKILIDLELYVFPGDRICLVGKNGSGKSSLMKIIEGEYEIDSGELYKAPAIKIGYLKQDMHTSFEGKIYDFVLSDFHNEELENNRYRADTIFEQLKIDGNSQLKNCSGGQVRRAFLAKALVHNPDILLLDEPTNHLDIIAIEWLEQYLSGYGGAVICISHDRTFQENISNKVWWIDRGTMRKSSKGFRYYDQWREEIIASEEAILQKMNKKLEAEKEWLHGGVTARRKRNQKRLANLYRLRESYAAHQNHLKQAKAKLHIELIEEAKKTKFIIEAENISYNFPDKKLFQNFTFKVKKGEKIGIIGPNGIGKSTFIRILTREILPESGKVRHGTDLEITYFDQYRTELNPNLSLKQTLCPGGGDQVRLKDRSMHVVPYLKNFMFDPKSIDDKVSTLSGGEANRLLLAKALVNPGNFLILDEPTNDLDMDSLEMLLEILADYTGTLIVVSHDRDFLERLVTRTLVFTGDKIIDLYGGYSDYLKYYNQEEPAVKVRKEKAAVPINTEKKLSSQKLSYKYVRLLESLPSEINSLEELIVDLEQRLCIPNLYLENNDEYNRLTSELINAKNKLEEKLNLWIEVENMKTSLEK